MQTVTGQWRLIEMAGAFRGLDMASVLALGRAKGISDAVMGEFLPDVESAIADGRRKIEG